MTPKHGITALAVGALGVLVGCATVDPQLDYERAAKHVAAATGQDSFYRPGDEEIVEQRVETLLDAGITAEESVEICLLNNPTLQAAFMDIGMARADVVQAGLFSNPSLGVALRLPAGGGLSNLEAGLGQNIADLWQIPVRKRVAQGELERAILDVAGLAADLATEAKIAYFDAVGTQQLHVTTLENSKIAGELLELAKRRQAAGAGTEVDVNLSRGVVVDAELVVAAARLAMAESRRSLATLLGLTDNADELVFLDPLPPAPARLPDLGQLLELSKQWRLDLQAAWQAVAAAEAALQEQHRLIIPFVELGVEMERGERGRAEGRKLVADTARASIANGALSAPDIQPRSERKQNTDSIIGPSLGLELPIFDQNQAQIARAKYAYEQAYKTLDALNRTITQEVRGALDRAATAWEIAQLYKTQAIPLAQRNLELSRKSYQVGKTSFLEVLEAQQFFLESRSKYIEALQAAAGTIPDLERTVGRPFGELIGAVAEEVTADAEDNQPREGEGP